MLLWWLIERVGVAGTDEDGGWEARCVSGGEAIRHGERVYCLNE